MIAGEICIVEGPKHTKVKENAFKLDKTGQNVRIFEEVIFFQATYNMKTEKQSISWLNLCHCDAGMLAEEKGQETTNTCMYHRSFGCFFLGCGDSVGGSTNYSLPALLPPPLEVDMNSHAPIARFRPRSAHSGSASWNDYGRAFLEELRVSSFSLIDSHTMPVQHIVNSLWLRWIKSVCAFISNQPATLLAEWQGPFTCYCCNTEVVRTPNKS